MRQSAEIFEVSIEGFTNIESITDESKLYYVFGEEQSLLFPETLKISAFFLPRFIAGPMILREMKKKIERDLDRNCGRIRTDYNDRIYKSAKVFQKAFEEKFTSAVEGTRTVLTRGLEKRKRSEKEADEAFDKIKKQKDQLYNIKAGLRAVNDSLKNTGGEYIGPRTES